MTMRKTQTETQAFSTGRPLDSTPGDVRASRAEADPATPGILQEAA